MLQMQRRSRMNFSRFRLFFFALLALCAVAVTVHSQEHGKPPERPLSTSWGHKVWSTEDGLPQNSVHGILQTRDGYLWAATEGGVARFNGFQFTVFNQESAPEFTSNDTCCLAEDRSGDLWIGTSDGLLRYAGGAFRRYTTADGLPSAIVESLAPTDDGSLLVLTAGGLARYEGQRFSALAPSASALGTGPGNAAWIAAAAGIFSYEHGHLRAASLPGLPPGSIEGLGSLKKWFPVGPDSHGSPVVESGPASDLACRPRVAWDSSAVFSRRFARDSVDRNRPGSCHVAICRRSRQCAT